jgi:hypothetical protein
MGRIGWEPRDVTLFWALKSKHTQDELADKFETTRSQIKNYIQRIEREAKKAKKTKRTDLYENLKNKFSKYLQKARTVREIENMFGNVSEKLLADEYPGLEFYKQINNFNQIVHILLPVYSQDIELKPRTVKHRYSVNEHGERQPYLLVNIPDRLLSEHGQIDILPIYDVHLGHTAHKKEKFLSYLRYIAETPNVFAVIGGDLMENALDDGRGMTYDTDKNPTNQLDHAIQLLAPVAHKIICGLPGNHEWRTMIHAGIDPMKVLCDRLQIPYFNGPVYVSVVCGDYKWKYHFSHGYGNSQTKGGKMNRAGGPKKYSDFINFIVSGHVHDPICNSETCVVEDAANCRLTYPQQWIIVAPSFLRWENTYAHRSGYGPPGSGGVVCRMYANGHWDAALT